jgi:peptidyl-dipeptidase A
MRASIRHIGVLVACLSAGAAAAAATASPPNNAKAGKKGKASPAQKEADAFLATVTGLVWPVSTSASLADWAAATDVTPDHVAQRTGADKALAAVTGSTTLIDKTKALLKNEKQLDDLTVRQLRKLLLTAAENPGTIPEVVAKRVELESKQSAILDGYTFCLQPKGNSCAKPITANDIDDILKKSRDLNERQRIWTVSKEIGRPLKPGLIELVKLLYNFYI